MNLSELLTGGGVGIVLLLSLIQIAPVQLNPWSAIAKTIGRALNAEVMEKIDANEAKTSRYRIIRFSDEICHKERHSEEHFNQIMEDIRDYEIYCREHPKFPNGKSVFAVKNIKQTYEKCKKEQSFL